MSREFPDYIDPWKAADGRRTFQGTMPLSWMERLSALLAPEYDVPGEDRVRWKEAEFKARFGYDRQGLLTVRLSVRAELPLICQRSLAPYLEKVERTSELVVIEDIAEQDLIPESYDPVLAEHRRMALRDIVEEELILAVPQVPRNPEISEVELSTDGEVRSPSVQEKEQSHRPFAGLAGLMKTQDKG